MKAACSVSICACEKVFGLSSDASDELAVREAEQVEARLLSGASCCTESEMSCHRDVPEYRHVRDLRTPGGES
jgi:hypothetical protein